VTENEHGLIAFCPGFYVDAGGTLYFHMREFLVANKLPDVPEIRMVILDEIGREFGDTPFQEISD